MPTSTESSARLILRVILLPSIRSRYILPLCCVHITQYHSFELLRLSYFLNFPFLVKHESTVSSVPKAGLRFYKIPFYKIKNPNTRISTHIHYYIHTIVLYRVVLCLVETNLVETKACRPERSAGQHIHLSYSRPS